MADSSDSDSEEDSRLREALDQGCKFCIFGQPGCEPKKSRSQKPKKKGDKKGEWERKEKRGESEKKREWKKLETSGKK